MIISEHSCYFVNAKYNNSVLLFLRWKSSETKRKQEKKKRLDVAILACVRVCVCAGVSERVHVSVVHEIICLHAVLAAPPRPTDRQTGCTPVIGPHYWRIYWSRDIRSARMHARTPVNKSDCMQIVSYPTNGRLGEVMNCTWMKIPTEFWRQKWLARHIYAGTSGFVFNVPSCIVATSN